MSAWMLFRIAIVAVGAFGLLLWLPALCVWIYQSRRDQSPWQIKAMMFLFGVDKVVTSLLILLIPLVSIHVTRPFALFGVLPLLVAGSVWRWHVGRRFPEYRSSD
jgi:NhaP-type Na+/H+ or K+/H+ antiporter